MSTPPAAPTTPAQLLASLRVVALVVTLVLVALGLVLWLTILPGSGFGLPGLATGVVLGVLGLAASRLVPPRRASPLVSARPPEEVLEQVRGSAFTALVVVEVVAVLAFAVSVVLGDRGPYLVTATLAVLALVLNATSPSAARRHLAHLESAGVATGLTL